MVASGGEDSGIPRLCEVVLRSLLDDDMAAEVIDDLSIEVSSRDGSTRWQRLSASLWCWKQVLSPHTLRLRWVHARRTEAESRTDRSRSPRGLARLTDVPRRLSRRPAYAGTVILLFAVPVAGATLTAILADAMAFRPFVQPGAERLASIRNDFMREGSRAVKATSGDLYDYRSRTTAFELIVGFGPWGDPVIDETADRTRAQVWRSSPELFQLLDVQPSAGRLLDQGDEVTAGQAGEAAVVSNAFWVRQLGADPAALGRTISLNGVATTVVGVLPSDFQVLAPPGSEASLVVDVWQTLPAPGESADRRFWWLHVLGQTRPDVSLEQAQAELDQVAAWQRANFEDRRDIGAEITVTPLVEHLFGSFWPLLTVLAAISGLVLVISASSVTSFALTLVERSVKEFSIRVACGARSRDVIGLVVGETLLLAVMGSALGLSTAAAFLPVLGTFAPPIALRLHPASLTGVGLLAGLGATGIIALPALLLGSVRAATLGSGFVSSGLVRNGPNSAQRWFLATQVAGAVVLTIGAGLLARSSAFAVASDPGFRTQRTHAGLVTGLGSASEHDLDALLQQIEREIGALPGVESAGTVFPLPLAGMSSFRGTYSALGGDPASRADAVGDFRSVSPGYFRTVEIPLIAGRVFGEGDRTGVVVIDETLAQSAFDGRDPLGRAIEHETFAGIDTSTVIGVVGSVRHVTPMEASGETIYFPVGSMSMGRQAVVFTATAAPPSDGALRAAVARARPDLEFEALAPMTEHVDRITLVPRRFGLVSTAASALTLLLTGLGVYGLFSLEMARRSREWSIRIALGARGTDVLRGVYREIGIILSIGLALGLVASGWAVGLIDHLVFGIQVTDPATYLGALLIVAGACVASVGRPAFRILRSDPARVLRESAS